MNTKEWVSLIDFFYLMLFIFIMVKSKQGIKKQIAAQNEILNGISKDIAIIAHERLNARITSLEAQVNGT